MRLYAVLALAAPLTLCRHQTDTLRREQAAVRREKQAAVSAAAEAKHAEGMRKQQLLQEKAAIAQVAVGVRRCSLVLRLVLHVP